MLMNIYMINIMDLAFAYIIHIGPLLILILPYTLYDYLFILMVQYNFLNMVLDKLNLTLSIPHNCKTTHFYE